MFPEYNQLLFPRFSSRKALFYAQSERKGKIIDSPKGDGNFTMSLLAVACNTDVVRLLILRKETETFHALLGVVCHFEVRLLILRKETETLSFPASTLSVAM